MCAVPRLGDTMFKSSTVEIDNTEIQSCTKKANKLVIRNPHTSTFITILRYNNSHCILPLSMQY